LRRLETIDAARRHVVALENLSRLVKELIEGESAGLAQLDVDTIDEALVRGRRQLSNEIAAYRDALDDLKVALGLSPHAVAIPDRRIVAAFADVRRNIDAWSRRPDRSLSTLPRIVEHLPEPGDIVVDGRQLLAAIDRDPARLEDRLREAAQRAIKNHGPGDDTALELRVRRRVRHLLETRRGYEDAKRGYVLAVRLSDESFERIVQGAPQGPSFRAPTVQGLINDLDRIREAEDRLVALWAEFRAERLEMYRDLGTLPYDNWDAFHADLSIRPRP
jgi:hypothetical protein